MTTSSAAVRSSLSHPVIDADGHFIEFLPGALDAIRDEGGPGVVDRVRVLEPSAPFGRLSDEERAQKRIPKGTWWAFPTRNTLDRATATFPSLLDERLGELGLDFAILYPSLSVFFPHIQDEDVRVAACRGINRYHAEIFRPFTHHFAPAALIPLHTPAEGVAALDHAVGLGLKTALIPSYVTRPVPTSPAERWNDTYGIDSDHDYDPFWNACIRHGIVPAGHSSANGRGWPARSSISSFVYNHIGHFAEAQEALCKSLLLGGVTRRFPALRVAFLEGGVAWAVRVLGDLAEHWEKRNVAALAEVDPEQLDRAMFRDLMVKHGADLLGDRDPDLVLDRMFPPLPRPTPEELDEWAASGIERRQDVADRFVPNFYFGCEPDDATARFAFASGNPFGARLHAMLGSDIGHFDVVDMRQVLHEAHEQVEKGRMTEDDFRDFTFANAARLYTANRPDFFAGTSVENEVRQVI